MSGTGPAYSRVAGDITACTGFRPRNAPRKVPVGAKSAFASAPRIGDEGVQIAIVKTRTLAENEAVQIELGAMTIGRL